MNFQTSNVTLFFEQYGEGQPLILLHGNGENHTIFEKAIPLLKKYFMVYAIDSRGHGKSSKVGVLHYEDMAKDVYEFIFGMHLYKPIVYGFSDGGIVALLLGIRYPGLLSRILVSGVNVNPHGIKFRWLILFKLYYFFTKSSALKLMLTEPDITTEMLGIIDIPVTLIGGSRDMIKQGHMKKIVNDIPNACFKVLKGETHSSYVVGSKKIAEIIIGELAI